METEKADKPESPDIERQPDITVVKKTENKIKIHSFFCNCHCSHCFLIGFCLVIAGVFITVVPASVAAENQAKEWIWVSMVLGGISSFIGAFLMANDHQKFVSFEMIRRKTPRELAREQSPDLYAIEPPATTSSSSESPDCVKHVVGAMVHETPGASKGDDQAPVDPKAASTA